MMNPTASMTGLWLENKQLSLRSLSIPSPGADEALIKLRLAGICGTDLELVKGYYPFCGIPGHEFVGEVVAAPADSTWVGRRVVGEINAACHDCSTCRAGRPTHCEQRTVLGIVNADGAFVEYFTMPIRNLHIVPESVSDETAVFTEPLAAACRILEQVRIAPTDNVLSVGAGRLGQLVAQALATTKCRLQVAAKHDEHRVLLEERGIQTIDPTKLPTRAMDVVVEATGNQSGFAAAAKSVRPGGTIVLKSTYHGTGNIDFSSLVVDEVTMVGSRCGPFATAIELMQSGQVALENLISKCYPLSQGPSAFEQAAIPGMLKVLLQP